MYITIWSEVAELLNVFAGSRPMNLHFVDMRGIADSEDFARIVGREVTAAVVLQSRSCYSAGFHYDASADGVAVAGDALQLQSQPIITLRRIVVKENRRPSVYSDKDRKSVV